MKQKLKTAVTEAHGHLARSEMQAKQKTTLDKQMIELQSELEMSVMQRRVADEKVSVCVEDGRVVYRRGVRGCVCEISLLEDGRKGETILSQKPSLKSPLSKALSQKPSLKSPRYLPSCSSDNVLFFSIISK
jgi:hypothetical protein